MSIRLVSVVLSFSLTSPKESAANDRSDWTDIRAVTDRRVAQQPTIKLPPWLLGGLRQDTARRIDF